MGPHDLGLFFFEKKNVSGSQVGGQFDVVHRLSKGEAHVMAVGGFDGGMPQKFRNDGQRVPVGEEAMSHKVTGSMGVAVGTSDSSMVTDPIPPLPQLSGPDGDAMTDGRSLLCPTTTI